MQDSQRTCLLCPRHCPHGCSYLGFVWNINPDSTSLYIASPAHPAPEAYSTSLYIASPAHPAPEAYSTSLYIKTPQSTGLRRWF